MATQLFLRVVGTKSGNLNNGLSLHVDPAFKSYGQYVTGIGVLGFSASRGAASEDNSGGFSGAGPVNFHPIQVYSTYPVNAAFTLSGDVTFNLWGRETNLAANAGFKVYLFRARDSDGSLTQILASAIGTELTTGNTAKNAAVTPASTSIAVGDRLVLWVGATDAGGTMASGHDLILATDGPTAAAVGDSYMTLTENVTFYDNSAPSGLQLFLTDNDSEVDPGPSFVAKTLSASRGGGVTSADLSLSGISSPTAGVQYTTPGATKIEWYSGRLAAFTLGGKIKFNMRGLVSGSLIQACPRVELAHVAADGSGATVVATNSSDPYWLVSEQVSAPILVIPDVTFDAGRRLRLRVYAEDTYFEAGRPISTSGSTSLKYAGTSGGASGDAWIQLSQSPSDYTPPSPPEEMTTPYTIQQAAVY